MNARDNYLTAAKGGRPERLPIFPLDCNVFMPDFWLERDPVTNTDFCNVRWIKNEAGEMPDTLWTALSDIHDWKKVCQFPDIKSMDWDGMTARFEAQKDPDKVNIAMVNTNGIFLIPINMMGWVDGLCAICDDEDEVAAFAGAITDFFIELIGYIGKYIHPDIMFTGDDFAAAGGPFLSKDTFRRIYKPLLTRINSAIHEAGALAEFHCCGNCQFLISEFLDCGADICQLPEPNESLLNDKKTFGKRLVITGGWDRHGPGNVPGASEDIVRKSVRTAIDTYGKDGALIFWDGGIIPSDDDSKNKLEWVTDEAVTYGSRVYAL